MADSLIMGHNETPLFTSCGRRVEPHRIYRCAPSPNPEVNNPGQADYS